jgi:riboflavin kinase/FMN adenylyltransferase
VLHFPPYWFTMMTSYAHSLEKVHLQNCWLTIGVFDGVHRGHRAILEHLTDGAHRANLPAVVLTFHPHPALVLGKQTDLKYLTTPDEKAELLGALGVDVVVTHPFDKEISELSADEFMRRIHTHLGVSQLVEGHDFALGHNRQGTLERLRELGETLGFRLQAVPPVRNGGEVVSSSLVRARLASGQVDEAAHALGRYYALSGPVVHGDGRGKKINVPTANVDCPPDKVIPANGVYACWVWLGGDKHPAVTNIGIRPTFTPESQQSHVETHILDFGRELYGQELKLEFVTRLRAEMRFPSAQALIEQIQYDIENGRKILK